jgi:CRISPR-associated protein Cas1
MGCMLAMRLHLSLTQAPVLPLSAGNQRRWGWWFLLHAAIGKPLHHHLSADPHGVPDVQVVLNPVLENHIPPLHAGQTLAVDLLLAASQDLPAAEVLRFLQHHLGPNNPVHLTHSSPLPPPALPPLHHAAPETLAEVVLEFQTPLPFRRETDSRTQISPATLGQLLAQRSRQVWGTSAGEAFQQLWDRQPMGHLLCGYWKFVDIPRASASQNRGINTHQRRSRLNKVGQHDPALHLQHHSGCLGRLYARQVSAELMAWLQALAPWHLHSSAGVSVWGGYTVTGEPCPWFDTQLAQVPALVSVAEATFRSYDVPPSHATRLHPAAQPAPETEAEMALLLAQELSQGTWQPEPTEGFYLPKANGRVRLVERLCLRDLVVHKRLGGLLAPVLDASFSPNSLGYRKGLSRTDATQRIRQLMREGHRWVVEADIEDFFPSADHARISAALDRLIPLADHTLRTLVARALCTPCQRNDPGSEAFAPSAPAAARTQGLAQGAPLSPLLANLLLDHLDKALEPVARDAMVRYADDFVLLARSQGQAEQLLHHVTHEVAELGLRLSADKTHITRIEDGFDFLGEHFDLDHLEDPLTADAGQRKPLVITDSYLHLGLNGQALDIRQDNKLIDTVPLRRISEVIIFGRNSLSTALMQRLAEHKVPVSVALSGGYQIAVLHPDSRRYHEIAWHQSRWYYSLNDAARLAIAQAFLDAKLQGYRALVRKRSPICAKTVEQIDQSLQALGECATIEQLRGHEGLAARATFAWLQTQIRPDLRPHFQAKRRARGGPDRINSLLNFGYYLSYTRLNGLLRAHGLNPYLGFLHDSLDDYETLVADLQELVRPFVDRLVIQLVNMGHIGPNAFEATDNGLYLSKPAARTMAREFERTMGQRVINQRLGDMLITQIRQLRAFMCEGAPLWLFHFGLQERDRAPASSQDSDADDAADEAAADEAEADEPPNPEPTDPEA